ncbi:MAG: TldD/PmbA family protein [Ruminococcaceae bacterium]|nr:TldD/PmbA family protein [Oscillospiraceae bacterium]
MLKDNLSPFKSLMADGAFTELRSQVNRKRRVSMIKGEIVTNMREDITGVGCRVYKDGLYGFASSPSLDNESIKRVLKKASENAAFMSSRIKKDRPAIADARVGGYATDYVRNDTEQKYYIEVLRELDDYISKNCTGLINRSLVAYEDSMEKMLVVSQGTDGHTIVPRSYIYIFMTVEGRDGNPLEVFTPVGGFGIFPENFSDLKEVYSETDRLYKLAMDKIDGVYSKAGLNTVILSGELAGMLAHEAVGHTVEADLVLAGSVAAKNLNKQVASPLVSMTDFAHTAFGKDAPLPVYLDDEGILAEDEVLIKDGILTGYMNSRETAGHFGMAPKGNARGFMFDDEPLIRMRNTAVLPGESSLDDMISSVDDGYYLISSNNGQADSTGEFMFGVTTGYEIKNGKLGRALLDTTISGIAFEMLKTVDMVGNEVSWSSSGFCGKKQLMPVGLGGPALRCKVMMGGR